MCFEIGFVRLFVLVSALLSAGTTSCAFAEETDPLAGLRREHPRLIWNAKRIAEVKQIVQEDPLARDWAARVKKTADHMLSQKPVEYVLIGPRLLDKSRTALERVTTLAGMYHLTGDKRYADRARTELLTVAAFADWHPPHFLDTAEMTNAVALGYDWLYDTLSVDDRATLRKAIVEKGLNAGLKIYEKGNGWSTNPNNWNQVCNGGMTVGALAIADEEPALSARIVNYARKSIPRSIATFGPDGGWPEGPGYWGYATAYTTYFLSAADTALGTDFGAAQIPGFSVTGNFRVQAIGPTNQTFNFADAHPGPGITPQMFWLAAKFNQPGWDALERQLAKSKPTIFHLIWFNQQFSSPSAEAALQAIAPSQLFKGVDVAFLRTGLARSGDTTTFVGFKGGDNQAGHSHLDLGTFVLDAEGQRWALDMGGDEYNLPGYFGKQRFTYYRLGTEGHNTMTFDGKNQVTTAKSPIIKFDSAVGHPFAIADLTAAYSDAKKVLRGVRLDASGAVLVQDEFEMSKEVAPVWNFHTNAEIKVDGPVATLREGGKTLEARILRPEGMKFEVLSANPPPPQEPAPLTKNLIIRLPKGEDTTVVVQLTSPGAKAGEVVPLRKW